MSYPYPQDRHRDRREKNEHQYEEAVEDYTEQQADIQRQASLPHERPRPKSTDVQEQDAEERFDEIGKDARGDRDAP